MTGDRERPGDTSGEQAEPGEDGRSAAFPIVSSAHLAAGGSPGLSEVEFGLILAGHGFSRWMTRCMGAAGYPGFSPLEILILHTTKHRDRPKRLADICLVLDIEDTHLATYAIRKLESVGLVTTGRRGKEKIVSATEKGAEACMNYAAIRERMLVRTVRASGLTEEALSEVAERLRSLSGHYDQAARAAATI